MTARRGDVVGDAVGLAVIACRFYFRTSCLRGVGIRASVGVTVCVAVGLAGGVAVGLAVDILVGYVVGEVVH